MAGIYLHIPFCKTRCIYCDFYSTTRSDLQAHYVQALCRELEQRREYLSGAPIETIYLGGGTPSQLTEEQLWQIFDTIDHVYGRKHCHEVTMEANPDDLSESYVQMLTRLPFNRISIGIQTFHDPTLRLLKRRHNSQMALEAVERCRCAGLDNISIDLMYGLPGETQEQWAEDLRQAIALAPEHISAYHLTYEEQTPIYTMLHKQQVREVEEEESLAFFSLLIDRLGQAGYEQYEISNFCRPDKHSRHNTSYWQGIPYLGCGPSAHSFDGHSRRWNVASVETYIRGIEAGKPSAETEELDLQTRYNEFIITTLRTAAGTSLQQIAEHFDRELLAYCRQMAAPYIAAGKLKEENGRLRLTRAGIFVSDSIVRDLLRVD